MKIRKFAPSMSFLTVLIFMPTFIGCTPKEEAQAVEPPKAGPNEVVKTFAVQGMTCEGCEQHVCESLQALPGVKSAKASHVERKAWVVMDKNGPANAILVKAIQAAGDEYKVEPIDK